MSASLPVAFQPAGGFLRRLLRIAVPLSLQSVMFTSVNLIDVVLLGRLGKAEVAGVGLADRALFVVLLVLMGVSTGAGILASQFAGINDHARMRQTLVTAALLGVGVASACNILAFAMPEALVGLGTKDPTVQAHGALYLRLVAPSLLFSAALLPIEVGLRSIDRTRVATRYAAMEGLLNVVLSYGLIFGVWGLPAWGVFGAAIATSGARAARTLLLFWHTQRFEGPLQLARPEVLSALQIERLRSLVRLSAPLGLNGFIWAFGVFVLQLIYGRIGLDELACMTVLWTVQRVFLGALASLGVAGGVVLGHELGRQQFALAKQHAWHAAAASALAGGLLATVLLLLKTPVLGFFSDIGPRALELSHALLPLVCIDLVMRAINVATILGALTAGGETRFRLLLDFVSAWLIAIPLTLIAAFWLHLPLFWVFLVALSEEGSKLLMAGWGVHRGRWLRNLTGEALLQR